MTPYEQARWDELNAHWAQRDNARGMPNWLHGLGERAAAVGRTTGEAAGKAARTVAENLPDPVREQARRAGDFMLDRTLEPTVRGVLELLRLVDDWAMELTDPDKVTELARARGLGIDTFTDLRDADLRDCDRLLTRNTLRWRTAGALEGGAMGALANVPYGGLPVAITLDVVLVQVMSTAIATRVAYSYGFDARDPAEKAFIDRLVSRSFIQQAAKIEPMRDAARAAQAVAGRKKWSAKLRADHKLVAAVEKFMAKWYPAGVAVPVRHVAKVVPAINVLLSAGTNSYTLGQVAADAQRYCATRFLCERHDLPLPAALAPLTMDDDKGEAGTD